MPVFEFSLKEVEYLLDALKKGASRHESYAKFSPASHKAVDHEHAAVAMRRLHRFMRIEALDQE